MRKYAQWILISAAVLLFVPQSWAADRVVEPDGTMYSVDVIQAPGGHSPSATALRYTRSSLNGTESGWVSPTQDSAADRDPTLLQVSGAAGPILIWSRSNGPFDQLAYSRFDGAQWTHPTFLTNTPHDHLRPQA